MNPDPGLSMVSEHSHPLDSAFPDSTSNSEWRDEMMALLIKWRAEDKERSMKWRAEDQERQLKYDILRQTLPQMTMKSDLDPVEKTHKPSGNFVEQMMCDPPDKALDGDRFGFADGDSQVHNTFTPKRFEDLKLNGGIRFKRIRIKQNYHRSRFKNLKSKSPRRTLDLKASLDLMGLATSQRRCVGVTTIGMKKQYNREKQSILLAQACKSLGMFGESSGCRDTKNELQIRLGARLIVDTGVKRETHLFRYGFTSLAPMDEDGPVATWIGDQSIFAEEVEALESDDPDGAMESLQDVTSMESELEEPSEHESREDLSRSGKHWFHKVRFKVRLRRSSKVTDEKVTKEGELFKLEKSELLHKGRKYTRKLIVRWYYYKVRKRVKPLGAVETGFKCLSKAGTEAGYKANIIVSAVGVMFPETLRQLDQKESVGKNASARHKELRYGEGEKRSCVVFHSNHVWKPGRISLKLPEPFWSLSGDSFKEMKVLLGVTGLEENQEEGLRRWNKGLKIIKLCTRYGFKSFRFLRSVKMRIWWLLKTSRRNQLSEFSLANQAWEPGGTVSLNTSVWLEIYHRHGGKWKSKLVRLYAEAKSLRRSRLERAYCVGKIQEASRVTKRLRTERGNAILIAAVENCLSYCEGAGSQNPNVDDNRVWNPGAVEVEGEKSCSSVIAEKLWNAENRKISVMDVHTNSENEVKWVVVLSVTLTLESQKSFSSPEYVITVQAFCFWSLEDKAAILSGSRLKFYGEKIEWICGVWDPGVAGYGQAKEVTRGIILMAKHDPIKYVVRVYKKRLRLRKVLAQVRKLDNLSLTEACKRTYAGISYTGAAVGDVWGIIAHIKKFLVIEKGCGVEFMGSRNYVTKGIWSCFWILVKFNILCHCVRNVCASRSLRWVHVFKIYKEATLSIMDVKLTMGSSGEHSVSVLTHELFHLPRPPELFCSLTLLKLQKMLKEYNERQEATNYHFPFINLRTSWISYGGSIDKIIWASSGLKRVNGPRSEKPSSEGNVFYVLGYKLCF
uniref:Uncharacterized protein n=1 Tax=Brassica campestris TaxID=3711 RepID=M4EIG7_BRACM